MTNMLEKAARALRKSCRDEFGTDWNNDVAVKFARAAIEAMRDPTKEMWSAGENANHNTMDNAMRGGGTLSAWKAMIDHALKGEIE